MGERLLRELQLQAPNELPAGKQFSTLHEPQVLIEQWRRHYNAIRPHSSLGYRPPGARDNLAASVCSALRCAPARSDVNVERETGILLRLVLEENRKDLPGKELS